MEQSPKCPRDDRDQSMSRSSKIETQVEVVLKIRESRTVVLLITLRYIYR